MFFQKVRNVFPKRPPCFPEERPPCFYRKIVFFLPNGRNVADPKPYLVFTEQSSGFFDQVFFFYTKGSPSVGAVPRKLSICLLYLQTRKILLINIRLMKSSRPLTTVGELREKRKERKSTIVAWLIILAVIGGIMLLAVVLFSPDTDTIYRTALRGIDYRLLSVLVMLLLGVLFTGICFFILRADKKRATLKAYLKVIPYTVIAGVVCHVLAVNLLLNLNRWMADEEAYEREYEVLEVRTQEPSKYGYFRYNLRFLLPALKELKVAQPAAPGTFLYVHLRPDSPIETGQWLKVRLRDGIFGWKVVESVSLKDREDCFNKDNR